MRIYLGNIGPILCGKHVESVEMNEEKVKERILSVLKAKSEQFIAIFSNEYTEVLDWLNSIEYETDLSQGNRTVYGANNPFKYVIVVANFSPGLGIYCLEDA